MSHTDYILLAVALLALAVVLVCSRAARIIVYRSLLRPAEDGFLLFEHGDVAYFRGPEPQPVSPRPPDGTQTPPAAPPARAQS